MPESAAHLSLVRDILDYIDHRFSGHTDLMVLSDLPTSACSDKPPRVGGYAPDVYAAEVPRMMVLIGEAKTATDLTTPHTRQQIAAFLKFLQYQQHGIFVLAVPWHCAPSARIVIASARRSLTSDSSRVEAVVLDGMKNKRDS